MMDRDAVQARIEQAAARLRERFPRITDCHTVLMQWREGDAPRWSLHLDIHWPQHQTLLNGPARDSAEAAIEAGFDKATEQMNER
jgi:hypothetical protein